MQRAAHDLSVIGIADGFWQLLPESCAICLPLASASRDAARDMPCSLPQDAALADENRKKRSLREVVTRDADVGRKRRQRRVGGQRQGPHRAHHDRDPLAPRRLRQRQAHGRVQRRGADQGWGVGDGVTRCPGSSAFPKRARCACWRRWSWRSRPTRWATACRRLPDGISGELMDVASGAFGEYEGRDATGKITLSELSYHPARHEKQRISALMGATGCVMMNWGHPENTAVPFGSVKPVWGNPTPETYRRRWRRCPASASPAPPASSCARC